jgi:SAM-dependent methyltransferase
MRSEEIARLYDERCEKSEFEWQAAAWGDENDQYGRYVLAGSCIGEDSSVLDVGCGQGGLLRFLREKKIGKTYTGVDVSPKMLKKARLLGDYFIEGDFMNEPLEVHDHVIALGTFSLINEDPYGYLRKSLARCFELCDKSLCTTFLIDNDEIKFPDDRLFYYDAVEAFRVCIGICPKIVFNTGSLSCEALVCMYK